MKSKILTFRDRFDILMEIRLSGVAKRLIWEMSDNNGTCERSVKFRIEFVFTGFYSYNLL